jgi:hypothetical protein
MDIETPFDAVRYLSREGVDLRDRAAVVEALKIGLADHEGGYAPRRWSAEAARLADEILAGSDPGPTRARFGTPDRVEVFSRTPFSSGEAHTVTILWFAAGAWVVSSDCVAESPRWFDREAAYAERTRVRDPRSKFRSGPRFGRRGSRVLSRIDLDAYGRFEFAWSEYR